MQQVCNKVKHFLIHFFSVRCLCVKGNLGLHRPLIATDSRGVVFLTLHLKLSLLGLKCCWTTSVSTHQHFPHVGICMWAWFVLEQSCQHKHAKVWHCSCGAVLKQFATWGEDAPSHGEGYWQRLLLMGRYVWHHVHFVTTVTACSNIALVWGF